MHSEVSTFWKQRMGSIRDATLLAYRTKKYSTTNYTLFYLMYGRKATLPIDLKFPGEENERDNSLMEWLYTLID